jgi:hypothetical protein
MGYWLDGLLRLCSKLRSMTMPIAQKNIDGRPVLSREDFFDQFYSDSGIPPDLVTELLELVASELRVEAGQVRPTDRFAVELTPGRWNQFDSGFAMLMTQLDSLARQRDKTITSPIETVDDYIRAMATVYFV